MSLEKTYKFYNSITFRLIFLFSSCFTLICVLIFTFTYFKTSQYLSAKIDEKLSEEVEELKAMLQKNGNDIFLKTIELETVIPRPYNSFVRIFNDKDDLAQAFTPPPWDRIGIDYEILKSLRNTEEKIYLTQEIEGRHQKARVIYSCLSPRMKIQMGVSKVDDDNLLGLLRISFSIFLLIIIPLSIFLSYMMAGMALKDFRNLLETASGIRAGNLKLRMPLPSPGNEVTNVVKAFNSMLDHLNNMMREQEEVIDSIAHDLRSPLTRMGGELEVLVSKSRSVDEYIQASYSILEDIKELKTMINIILDMSYMEIQVSQNKRLINLKEFLIDIIDIFQYSAEAKECRITLSCPASVSIRIEPVSMKRAIANLLDNAVKYARENGKIEVVVQMAGNLAEISVIDNGIGIDEGDIDNIFKRFYRCDASRTEEGYGLGLSLAECIVKAHRGKIKAYSQKSIRTQFTITLPEECFIT